MVTIYDKCSQQGQQRQSRESSRERVDRHAIFRSPVDQDLGEDRTTPPDMPGDYNARMSTSSQKHHRGGSSRENASRSSSSRELGGTREHNNSSRCPRYLSPGDNSSVDLANKNGLDTSKDSRRPRHNGGEERSRDGGGKENRSNRNNSNSNSSSRERGSGGRRARFGSAGEDNDDGISDISALKILKTEDSAGFSVGGSGRIVGGGGSSSGGGGGNGMGGKEPAVKGCGFMTTMTFMKMVRHPTFIPAPTHC